MYKSYPPKEYPETLYKYRTWSNEYHRKILTENQLFLSSPVDFNDPFDCRIGKDFSLLDSTEKITEYAETITSRHKDILKKKGLNPEKEKQRIINKLITDVASVQKGDDQITFKMQDKHFGVLSMSARFDSILMWSHYAEFHQGFCVGFDEVKMRESKLFGKGGLVDYDDEFPKIDPRNNRKMQTSFLQTHTKAKDWNYEKEYRLTKLFFPNEPTSLDRIVTVPEDFITEIILGLKTPYTHKEEIVKIGKEKRLPIYQIEQVPFEFKIMKKLI